MHSALSSTTHKCSEKEDVLHSEFRGELTLIKYIEEHKKEMGRKKAHCFFFCGGLGYLGFCLFVCLDILFVWLVGF